MASNDLRAELDCSICVSPYTDPVMLSCGHNFCRVCIDCVLETQDQSGVYSCPECRHKFRQRPVLIRNAPSHRITENFKSTQPMQTKNGICCTYCVDSPVPAVKSCLHSEASLCDKHLKVHSKSPEHVLSDPSTDLEKRKCPVHNKVLKYYCTVDSACICETCSLAGEHRGHQVEMLDEAFEEKKKKLGRAVQELTKEILEIKNKIKSLEESRAEGEQNTNRLIERHNAAIADLWRNLAKKNKRILSEILMQKMQDTERLNSKIQLQTKKMDEFCRRMKHTEELCNMTDPLSILQYPDIGDLCDPDEEEDAQDTGECGRGLLDLDNQNMVVISDRIHKIGGIVREIRSGIFAKGPEELLLDVNTAGCNVCISENQKTIFWARKNQDRPQSAERFRRVSQVISNIRFSSGRHYWDVKCSKTSEWSVGMCYPSIDRKGDNARIGYNNKSWCLDHKSGAFTVSHDLSEASLSAELLTNRYRFRICLDYEAGRLSFYELTDPIRYLFTFTGTFTEPLHAAIYISHGYVRLLGQAGTKGAFTLQLVTGYCYGFFVLCSI